MSKGTASIAQDLATLTDWAVENLNMAIAIDSQSDEASTSIPSTEGQKHLSAALEARFRGWGFETSADDFANLLVRLPSNLPEGSAAPSIAMMVHLDTSEGTFPIPKLLETPAWDGSKLAFPDNDRLHVSHEVYPETACFLGQDLLHGTGRSPVGLDNKLGMAEIMTLAQVLQANPEIPHGEIHLVFRPDEEIGRMEAVEGLADEFAKKGIRYGYTIDGLDPFEINVENFNASRARVDIKGQPLETSFAQVAHQLKLKIYGVKSHGATAKAEGYHNATMILTEVMGRLGEQKYVVPVDMASDPIAEVNADVTFCLLCQDPVGVQAAKSLLLEALDEALKPHALRGAFVEIVEEVTLEDVPVCTDEVLQLTKHLSAFLRSPGVSPLLSEDSENYEGYTNPYFVERLDATTLQLSYRVRAFTAEERAQREAHLESLCADNDRCTIEVTQQYVNMGPALTQYPELVAWAKSAAAALDITPKERPIRGGTGVDPFIERDIPIANLGTGYFAPESEKEFTSRQTLGQHVLWLLALVQEIAKA